jgi:methyl coenzyme M reductase subunit C-like uncharacterized protein (methanogenesis marker protein 7)
MAADCEDGLEAKVSDFRLDLAIFPLGAFPGCVNTKKLSFFDSNNKAQFKVFM